MDYQETLLSAKMLSCRDEYPIKTFNNIFEMNKTGEHTVSTRWCVFIAMIMAMTISTMAQNTGAPNTTWFDANPNATSFTISTADELAGLAVILPRGNGGIFTGKTITLANDIDLSVYGEGTASNQGRGWLPIGNSFRPFTGTFDGAGYVIKNLFVNHAFGSAIGLFGVISQGSVRNLGLENVNITANSTVGSVTGQIQSGSIINCYSSGTLKGNIVVGGLVGDLRNSSITNCYSIATVYGNNVVGGLVGEIWRTGSVTNCYSTGTVAGKDNVGGLAGSVTSGNITSSAALNLSVSGNDFVCRVAGLGKEDFIISNNVAFSEMSNDSGAVFSNDGDLCGEDITAKQLQTASGFPTPLTQDPWTYEPGKLPGLFGNTVDMPEHIVE